MSIPDYVSPIIGHRVWRWDGSNLMSLNGELWHPSLPLAAECRKGADCHQAPHTGCTCGVYAAKSVDQLRQLGYARLSIYGEVYLWGTVVEHELGWRAQFAYPRCCVLPVETMPLGMDEVMSLLQALGAYGVDIFATDEEASIRLWKKDTGYDSAGLDWLSRKWKSVSRDSPIVAYSSWVWEPSGLKSLDELVKEDPIWPWRQMSACFEGFASKRLDDLVKENQIWHQLGSRGLLINGEVYLWGNVVEHKGGWRAQFAHSKTFVLPPESLLFGRFVERELSMEEVESHVGTLTTYGADLFVAAQKQNVPLWAKQSGYNLAGINCLSADATRPAAAVPIAILMDGRSPHSLAQNGFELTHPAEIAFTEARFPLSPADPIVRQIQNRRARVVALDLNLQNLQSILPVVEIIRRVAGHLALVVRGDQSIPLRPMIAAQLGTNEYMARDSGYAILDTFVCLSKGRWTTSATDREAPPTAPVYAPIGRGPRPLRPREVAVEI